MLLCGLCDGLPDNTPRLPVMRAGKFEPASEERLGPSVPNCKVNEGLQVLLPGVKDG